MRVWSSLLLLACVYTVSYAGVQDFGQCGRVYPVLERDALEEIEEKASSLLPLLSFLRERTESPDIEGLPLPPARTPRRFSFEPVFEVEEDIVDESGNVLYPKGFRFNPLEYVSQSGTYVFLDGTDRKQLAWFERRKKNLPDTVTVLVTRGDPGELSRRTGKAVYRATREVSGALRVEHTPAVVRIGGGRIEVEEEVAE
jgi:conjugal transfer pilus assembly protein TraW